MVVRPVAAVVGAVGRTFALVEFGADQYVNDQTIGHVHAPDLARWQRSMTAKLANDMDRIFAVQHLRVTRDQYPHIVQMGHGPWQRCRNVAQATGLHQVGNFRGDEQHFFTVGILVGCRSQRPGARNADGLGVCGSYGARFADLMSTLSLYFQSRTDHMNLPCC
ncbi:hypothetical protein D3C76_869640 [compost metagenome]